MIESFSFGDMVIDGRRITSDLIIYPNGVIQDGWWRSRGHTLIRKDIQALVDSKPEMIIVGMGINGLMKPERGLDKWIQNQGIHYMAGPNDKAVAWYNQKSGQAIVGACFHLTC
jgi:hypothetical protein